MGQDGAKMGQHRPKIGPRWGQDGPRWAQDGPRWAQHRPKMGQHRAKMGQDVAKVQHRKMAKNPHVSGAHGGGTLAFLLRRRRALPAGHGHDGAYAPGRARGGQHKAKIGPT